MIVFSPVLQIKIYYLGHTIHRVEKTAMFVLSFSSNRSFLGAPGGEPGPEPRGQGLPAGGPGDRGHPATGH